MATTTEPKPLFKPFTDTFSIGASIRVVDGFLASFFQPEIRRQTSFGSAEYWLCDPDDEQKVLGVRIRELSDEVTEIRFLDFPKLPDECKPIMNGVNTEFGNAFDLELSKEIERRSAAHLRYIRYCRNANAQNTIANAVKSELMAEFMNGYEMLLDDSVNEQVRPMLSSGTKTKSKRGPHTYSTAEKRAAVEGWEKLDRDTDKIPLLAEYLYHLFPDRPPANSTFYRWRNELNR